MIHGLSHAGLGAVAALLVVAGISDFPPGADLILRFAGLGSLIAAAISVARERSRDHARAALYGSLIGAIAGALGLLLNAILRLL